MTKSKDNNNDWKLEFTALCGFSLSGVIAIYSALQNGDTLTLIGSIIWFLSCLIWMIPYRKHFNKPH